MKYKKIITTLLPVSDTLPRRHKIKSSSEQLSCIPFFITGSGRNGSTLLAAILNKHSKIMLPPEQFALPFMAIKYRLLNFLEWEDLVKIIIGEIASDWGNLNWKVDFSGLYTKLYTLPKEQQTFRKIIDEIFIWYGQKHDLSFSHWGDKSPHNTRNFKYWFNVYPDAKYVFLLRDGRDVIASYTKDKEYFKEHSDIANAIKIWNQSIEVYDLLKKKIPAERFHLLRYEDLVTDPEKELKKLIHFLGFEYEEQMLSFQDQASQLGIADASAHQNLKNKLNPASIGNWKKEFNEKQLQIIIPAVEKNLQKFSYS